MRSPVANKKRMMRVELETGLFAYRCEETDGMFLPINSYFQWLGNQPERLPHLPQDEACLAVLPSDSEEAKICPESGQLMLRYKIGDGFSFYVDRSPSGSLWFDKGEWDTLRKRQYHDELHLMFTFSWQSKIRAAERAQNERLLLEERFGASLLQELDCLYESLIDHPHREMAIAYLNR